jgi:hypothetical protein
MKASPYAVIGGVVTLILIAAALVCGLAVTGHLDSQSTPLITVIFGLIAPSLTALLTMMRVEAVSHELKNGLIPSKIMEALQQHDDQSGATELRDNLNSALDNGGIIATEPPKGGLTNGR